MNKIPKTIKELSQKKFVQDVSVLQVGSFFSLAVSAIGSIVIARLLGAETYGLYALIFAFVGLVSLFMDWGAGYSALTLFPAAYVEKNKKEIKNILSYFVYLSLLIFLTVGLLALIISPILTSWFYQNPEIGQMARLLFLAVLIRILFSMLTLILQSIREIKKLTIIENFNKLIYLILPVSFVLLGYGLWGIVFGHFFSAIIFFIISLLILSRLSKRDNLIPSLSQILRNLKNIRFRKYFGFGLLISVNKNLTNLYTILPVFLLGMFAANTSQTAFFKIASSYLALPLVFMTPISRILIVQLPKSLVYGGKIFKDNFKKASLTSGLIFLLLLIPFVLLAPVLIKFLYGQEFLPAIKLIYVLLLGWVLAGLAVGYGSFFRTLNKMRPLLVINLSIIASGLALFFILNKFFFSPLESAVSLSIYFGFGGILLQTLFVVKYFKKIKND